MRERSTPDPDRGHLFERKAGVRTLGAVTVLFLFTGLLLACPFHGAGDQGSGPLRAPAADGACVVVCNLPAAQSLPVQPIPPTVLETAFVSQTGVLSMWLLLHSVEHPPG